VCYAAEFDRSKSNGTCVIKEINMKKMTIVSRLLRSLKVVGTDDYRSIMISYLNVP